LATVLIIGASRGIGLEAVQQALEAGHQVRALSRSADGILISHPNLEKVTGDALDTTTVLAALKGMDAVIQTLGVSPGPDMILKPVRLFSKATRVLVDAMNEAGVKRLICVTGLGAGDSRGKGGCIYNNFFFPLLLKRAYDDKDVQEDIIRNSTLDWVIARPVLLTRGPRTGAYEAVLDPDKWRAGAISRADVADFLVKQIDDDSYLGTTPMLVKTPLPNI
jgi:putative NADH-flavin reductase